MLLGCAFCLLQYPYPLLAPSSPPHLCSLAVPPARLHEDSHDSTWSTWDIQADLPVSRCLIPAKSFFFFPFKVMLTLPGLGCLGVGGDGVSLVYVSHGQESPLVSLPWPDRMISCVQWQQHDDFLYRVAAFCQGQVEMGIILRFPRMATLAAVLALYRLAHFPRPLLRLSLAAQGCHTQTLSSPS